MAQSEFDTYRIHIGSKEDKTFNSYEVSIHVHKREGTVRYSIVHELYG